MWYFVLVHHKAALTPLHAIMVTAYVIEIGFPGGCAIGSYDCDLCTNLSSIALGHPISQHICIKGMSANINEQQTHAVYFKDGHRNTELEPSPQQPKQRSTVPPSQL